MISANHQYSVVGFLLPKIGEKWSTDCDIPISYTSGKHIANRAEQTKGEKSWRRMNKNNLQHGRKYLHKRQTEISGHTRTAERWLKCERNTDTGAIYSRDFEPEIELSDEQIEKELTEGWEK